MGVSTLLQGTQATQLGGREVPLEQPGLWRALAPALDFTHLGWRAPSDSGTCSAHPHKASWGPWTRPTEGRGGPGVPASSPRARSFGRFPLQSPRAAVLGSADPGRGSPRGPGSCTPSLTGHAQPVLQHRWGGTLQGSMLLGPERTSCRHYFSPRSMEGCRRRSSLVHGKNLLCPPGPPAVQGGPPAWRERRWALTVPLAVAEVLQAANVPSRQQEGLERPDCPVGDDHQPVGVLHHHPRLQAAKTQQRSAAHPISSTPAPRPREEAPPSSPPPAGRTRGAGGCPAPAGVSAASAPPGRLRRAGSCWPRSERGEKATVLSRARRAAGGWAWKPNPASWATRRPGLPPAGEAPTRGHKAHVRDGEEQARLQHRAGGRRLEPDQAGQGRARAGAVGS